MARLKASALLFLVFAFATAGTAQERVTAGEVFNWFPEGSYRTLAHIDYSLIKNNENFGIFKELFGDLGVDESTDSIPLPESVADAVEKLTYAQLMKLRIRETVVEEGKKGGHSHDSMLSQATTNAEGKPVLRTTENTGGKLWVFTFEDTPGLVKQAVKDGWLSRAGMRINKLPVYKLVARGAEESQADYFAYATATNELLVAEEMEQLELMIKAGYGAGLSLLDDSDYQDLLPYVQDLGQTWRIRPNRVQIREQIDLWSRNPDMDDKVRELEEKLNTDVQYEISTFELTDVLKAIQMKIFGDEELAEQEAVRVSGEMEQARQGIKSGMKEARQQVQNIDQSEEGQKLSEEQKQLATRMVNRAMGFADNLLESQETTVEGTVVKTVITFGERQLNTLKFLLGAAKVFEKFDQKHDQEKK
ncbi:MAG TPA: hypothetical protein VMX35_13605 [Acidobacteriota bacterium]|nr:hypothetical protein [Acidobacteriota bacterium]